MKQKNLLIAGVDEAGRGPLFGSVFAAAVILKENHGIVGLADSKKLSEKKREQLFPEICDNSIAFNIASATALEIDKYNILQATYLAMQRAVLGLSTLPEKILIDGNSAPSFTANNLIDGSNNLPISNFATTKSSEKFNPVVETIIKGDSKFECISAASILAKVARDREMKKFSLEYPEYGFEKHKGYPTKAHLEALNKYKPIKGLHRFSYKPVKILELVD